MIYIYIYSTYTYIYIFFQYTVYTSPIFVMTPSPLCRGPGRGAGTEEDAATDAKGGRGAADFWGFGHRWNYV